MSNFFKVLFLTAVLIFSTACEKSVDKSELNKVNSEIEDLIKQKESLEVSLKRLSSSKSDLIDKVGELNLNVDKLSTENEVLSTINMQMSDANATLRTEKYDLNTAKSQLEAENAQLSTNKSDLVTDNAALSTEKTQLVTDNAALSTEKTQLESDKSALETDNAALSTEKTQLESDNTQLEDDKEALNRRNKELEEILDVLLSFQAVGGNDYQNVVDAIEVMKAKSLDINIQENFAGLTLLHYAARKTNNIDIITYLLTEGSDISIRSNTGRTSLHFATADSGRTDSEKLLIAEVLINSGVDLNAIVYETNETALLFAVYREMPFEFVNLLINAGTDTSIKRINPNESPTAPIKISGNTILHEVARNYVRNPVELSTLLNSLMAQNANVNSVNDYGKTPLHVFIEKTNLSTRNGWSIDADLYDEVNPIIGLLSDATTINIQDNDGETPLHLAAFNWERLSGFEALLNSSTITDLSILNNVGDTALDIGYWQSQAIQNLLNPTPDA